jgi:hypothetical protein
MAKRQLLFVAYRDENIEEGVSYAIKLAKAMYQDITLLLVQKKSNLMDKLGNLVTAVSFAEPDKYEMARDIVASGETDTPHYEKVIVGLREKCHKEGIEVSFQDTDHDVVAGVRAFLKDHVGIDKVVLSPAVTGSDTVSAKDLNRLARTVSRPFVTITKRNSGTAS